MTGSSILNFLLEYKLFKSVHVPQGTILAGSTHLDVIFSVSFGSKNFLISILILL